MRKTTNKPKHYIKVPRVQLSDVSFLTLGRCFIDRLLYQTAHFLLGLFHKSFHLKLREEAVLFMVL